MKPKTSGTPGSRDGEVGLQVPLGVALDDATRTLLSSVTKKLFAPFPEADIEWLMKEDDVTRSTDGSLRGRCFAYVTARAVQQRLDDIFGVSGWETKMNPAGFGTGTRSGIICELTLTLPGIGKVTKTDACDLSSLEPVKGGASGAVKRAAVQFGIGRYLYSLPESFVRLSDSGVRRIRVENKVHQWDPPLLPPWALPEGDRPARIKLLKKLAKKDAADLKQRQEAEASQALAKTAQAAADAAKTAQAQKATTDTAATPTPAPQQKNPAPAPLEVKTAGLSMGVVTQLQDLLGKDMRLAVAYLKFKKMLPMGATSIEQLPATHAMTLIGNAKNVKARMAMLAPVAALIKGPYEHATTLFVDRGLVKSAEPWFVASEENLKSVLGKSAAFTRALEKMAESQEQQRAA